MIGISDPILLSTSARVSVYHLAKPLFLVIPFFLITSAFAQAVPVVTDPSPSLIFSQDEFTLELYFESIAQGQVGLVHIDGPGIKSVQASFLGDDFSFFRVVDDGYYGLLSVGMNQSVRRYDLTITIQTEDGSNHIIAVPIEISLGTFIREDINLTDDLGFLVDPEVESHELMWLRTLTETYTSEQLWDERGFQPPLQAELTSPFGAFRVFNQTSDSRHTGWDMRARMGQPVSAIAAGRVVFAGPLDLRGNYVLIDHGFGVYSGYAHFSVVHVTRGQAIAAGQIIGQVGSSGRSSGAHFHWEMVVNGEWIDGVAFTSMWLPLPINEH